MNHTSRIRQIEKKAEQVDGTVHIEVERCFDRDIEPEYAVPDKPMKKKTSHKRIES